MATSFAPIFSNAAPQRERGLPAGRLAAFSALFVPITAAQLPILNFLPAIYSQQFGISLAALGTIFLIERLWGAFADPVVGALSDRTRSRYGRRRPWIAAGVAVFGLAGAAMFFPPSGITPLYLGVALFAFYLGWSMMQIPYLAWSGEISGEYHERTRITTFTTVATALAALLVMALPAAIDQLHLGNDRLKLGAMGTVILLTLLPAAWLTLRSFPENAPITPPARRAGFVETARVVLAEKLMLRVVLSDLAVTFGQGTRNTLLLFVVTFYMGEPTLGATLMLVQYVFGLTAGPIWMQVARRLGKNRTAVVSELTQSAINFALVLVAPGNLGLLFALTIAQGLTQSSGNLMLRAMVADVADHHRLKTGQDRTALFYSAFSVSMKAGMALAVGVSLPLVGWFGFDPTPGATNTPQALNALLLIFALGPALAHLAAALLLRGFTLDEAAHEAVRRELDRRAAAAGAHPSR